MAQGLATSEGRYLKILGGGAGGKNGKTKGVTEADKKVLDFRLQGASCLRACVHADVCDCLADRRLVCSLLFFSPVPHVQPPSRDTHAAVRRLEVTLARREADMLEAKTRAVALHKQGLTHSAAVELARSKRTGEAVGKLRSAVLNLLTLHYSIEGVAADVVIFEGLKGGNAALRRQREEAAAALSVKDVDEAMEEARELVAEASEVSAALAQPMGAGAEAAATEEEAELLKELEALEEEHAMADAAAVFLLPDVSHLPPPRVDLDNEGKEATSPASQAATAGKAKAPVAK